MDPELTAAIVLITGALASYSLGVWAERLQRRLRPWHAVCFAIGLTCDVSGTAVMTGIAASGSSASGGGPLIAVMAVTGTIAIVLMAAHLVWALVVLTRGSEAARSRFHRISTAVWLVRLVPCIAGAVGANAR